MKKKMIIKNHKRKLSKKKSLKNPLLPRMNLFSLTWKMISLKMMTLSLKKKMTLKTFLMNMKRMMNLKMKKKIMRIGVLKTNMMLMNSTMV
jgi:hypothetical protein